MPSRKTLLRILTAAMVVVMLASVAVIAATAGTDSDPLVTRSYLEGPYKKTLLSVLRAQLRARSRRWNAVWISAFNHLHQIFQTRCRTARRQSPPTRRRPWRPARA